MTGDDVTPKVAVDWPSGTRIVAGTAAACGLLLDSATVAPPAKAGPLSVTVPVAPDPPGIVDGSTLTEETARGSTARFAETVSPETDAVTETVVPAATDVVAIATLPEICPATIVMLPGSVATEGLLDVSATVIPPDGAGFTSVTVAVAEPPPRMVDGEIAMEPRMGGVMASEADATTGLVVTPYEPN